MSESDETPKKKALGAYYTDSQVADFLVWWALRDSKDRVLDPSFGGGVFLRSAAKRLRQLEGAGGKQVFGVEIDPYVHDEISALLRREFRLGHSNLLRSDFFDVSPEAWPKFDVVIGNPPFIRYHRFTGESRKNALSRAAEVGVSLSQLCSSWLPFLIHSIRFLATGGRLAMVIPFELCHARYARPALRYLAESFSTVTFLTFRKKLFPDLSEDTLLLLADGRRTGPPTARFCVRDIAHSGKLADFESRNRFSIQGIRDLDTGSIVNGQERLIESYIAEEARALYRELRSDQSTMALGQLADVGIGYVTGANNFFHLSKTSAREWQIPERYLRPCVRRGSSFSGLKMTSKDWEDQLSTGDTGYLLNVPDERDLPELLLTYLRYGEQQKVHTGFKCRNRSPWYRVPNVYQPDAFLTYMCGTVPRLVANHSNAVAPNTLHILRTHPDSSYSGDAISALWQTSLTQLSVEIEGHALGGGMLKMEPTEAEQVLVPASGSNEAIEGLATELDAIARSRGEIACREYADDHLLRRRLGLTNKDISHLRSAGEKLRERRTSRNALNG